MGLKEAVWPWGALKKAQASHGSAEKQLMGLRLEVAASRALLARAYFRDPNTGRFLDQGVLPPPKKEVLNI